MHASAASASSKDPAYSGRKWQVSHCLQSLWLFPENKGMFQWNHWRNLNLVMRNLWSLDYKVKHNNWTYYCTKRNKLAVSNIFWIHYNILHKWHNEKQIIQCEKRTNNHVKFSRKFKIVMTFFFFFLIK